MQPLIITIVLLTNVLRFEVASTESEREKGLMNRRKWGSIDGMLFIHEKPEEVSYWMKNTYLDIFMIFIDENFNPKEIYKPEKLSTKIISSSNTNIKYVLELKYSYSNLIEKENLKELIHKISNKLGGLNER
ncbi:MAG: DUF192 domain-containing protein [Brevinematales bacterium]|nr:DUF192 domain-containing protein [Brevinematales bacterium]